MQALPVPTDDYPRRQASSRPRILFVVDVPNWAHDIKTRNLMRVLSNEYDVQKRYEAELTSADLDDADLILVYYWYQFEATRHLEACFRKHRHKLLIGVCSHAEVEGPRGETGKAILRELARAIFMINLFLYRDHAHLFDVPVFHTPNGVDVEFYKPVSAKQSSDSMRVGWAGSLTNHGLDHRGYYDLILPAISSIEGVELVTAAREEKWRCPEEMREFYRSLDLYLCASRDEGAPNPCLESAACGVPLLTTRVGAMPELVRHGVNGFFVERDQEDISSKLRLLRDNPDLRGRMARQIREDIKLWDWSVRADAYRRMFEQTLNGQPTIGAVTTQVFDAPEAATEDLAVPADPVDPALIKEAVIKAARSRLLLLPDNFVAGRRETEITVVMLSHGRVELTLNAIRSLRDNVALPFKLLLIDNGSSLGVKDKLTQSCSEYDFIELILLDENLGCAGGRMFSLDHVETLYVMFIDNDIEICPGAVEHLLYALESNPELLGAAGTVILPDGLVHLCGGDYWTNDGVLSYELLGRGLRFDDPLLGGSGPCKWINGGATMFRKSTFDTHPFDLLMQGYYEDLEWCYRLNEMGAGRFYKSAEALTLHYHEFAALQESIATADRREQAKKYLESIAHFYKSHGKIIQNIFDFVPELRPPNDELVISAARMFVELVNSLGTEWVLEKWNRNELDSLFAATRVANQSAQLASQSEQLTTQSAQLASQGEHLVSQSAQLANQSEQLAAQSEQLAAQSIELEDQATQLADARERVIESTNRQAALIAKAMEDDKVIETLSGQLVNREQLAQEIASELREKQQSIETLLTQVSEKQKSIESLSSHVSLLDAQLKRMTNTLGWRLLSVYGKIKYRYLLPVHRRIRQKKTE